MGRYKRNQRNGVQRTWDSTGIKRRRVHNINDQRIEPLFKMGRGR